LGQIKDVLYMMEWHMEDYLPLESIYMIELSKRMSRTPMGGQAKYTFPVYGLREELGRI